MFYKRSEVVKNNVAVLRKEARFTQQQLADEIGVTRQTVIAIEKGNYIPSILLAIKLSRTLKHPVEEIFSI
jgi:putative transcriptional regulator